MLIHFLYSEVVMNIKLEHAPSKDAILLTIFCAFHIIHDPWMYCFNNNIHTIGYLFVGCIWIDGRMPSGIFRRPRHRSAIDSVQR